MADCTAAAEYAAVAENVAAEASKLPRADSAAVEAIKVLLTDCAAVNLSLPVCRAVEASTLL